MRVLAWLTVVATLCVGTLAQAAPLAAYGGLPNIEDVALSSDGSRMAVIITDGEKRSVLIRDLNTGTNDLLSAGDAKVRSLEWAGPKHLLITTTTTASILYVTGPRREYATVVAYDAETRKPHRLMDDVPNSLNVVYGGPILRVVGGKPTVFLQGVHFVNSRGRLALFKADLVRARTELVHQGFPDTRDWLVDADGQPLAQSEYDPKSGRWALRAKEGPGWRVLLSGQNLHGYPTLWGLGRDGRSILIGSDDEDGGRELKEMPLSGTGGESIPLQENETPIYDPARHNLIGFRSLVGDEFRYRFFAEKDQRAWEMVKKAYPGQLVTLASWSDDRNRLIVRVDSPTEGPAYALVDFKTKKADWIGNLYEAVKPADVSPVRAIAFKAADGTPLTGYLTLPRNRPEKGLPLVVLPHGGPASRDTPGFDYWSQAIASRGYAVLQVNFRGSRGFGHAFLASGYGQWGRKMQTDLSDGVRWLDQQGVIDPKRVCIVGGSYGGYAALAGVALDREVYRCAASVSGPSDMRRMIAWSRGQNGVSAVRYWTRFMGAQNLDDPVLRAISPALNVDKVTAPVLLIHGRDDTVVPLEQSRIMADALTKAGKPVEFVVLKGDDHWLSRGDTRLQMLTSMVAFLEKHNPPN